MLFVTLRRLRIALVLAIAAAMLLPATAKRRGCLSYGHSCLGGHGKRSGGALVQRSILNPADRLLLQRLQIRNDDDEERIRADEMGVDDLEESQINYPSYDDRKSALLWKKLLLSSQQRELEDIKDALDSYEA